jgi:two-component system OmpR family sensor kinase
MFRSLATRLTATYVFAAMVLVVIVVAAVTTFALSMFGVSARETSDEVARQVPEEVRLELGRWGSLAAAAPDIARHLSRPGLRVIVLQQDGLRRHFLAASMPLEPGESVAKVVLPGHTVLPGHNFFMGPAGPVIGGPGIGMMPGLMWPGWLSGPGWPAGPGGRSWSGGPGGLGSFGGPGDTGGYGSDGPPRRFEHMDPYPFSLNFFLHIQPRDVLFTNGRVSLVPDPGDLIRAINAFWFAMIPIGLFVVVAAWLLGRYITGQALRPLVETTASLRQFGAGDFAPRPVETTSRDEIGELVRAYNAAAAQVSSAFEERRAAEGEMRQFIADAGHELRTPLTVIMGFIDVLRRRAQNESGAATKIFDTMLAESRRMKALIDKLIVLARLENPHERELETVDLVQIAGNVATALQALGSGPRIALQIDSEGLVRGYESELHDALSNLVENALKYAPESPVDVRVYGDRDMVCVDVIDRGPGIPQDEQAHVFARFYRGRDRSDAEGFGLGLAIAKRAVERAGGTLTLSSEPERGCRFSIGIPRATRGESVTLAV